RTGARAAHPAGGTLPPAAGNGGRALVQRTAAQWAVVLTRDLPSAIDLRTAPGTGASGGLGAGLAALGARLLPRFEVLLDRLDLDARLARADLVITAEGALDHQTVRGKIPAEVASRAHAAGVPVFVLAGTIGPGAHLVRAIGVDAYSAILPEAIEGSREILADATERALRILELGTRPAVRAA
ncbi:glycerate kinase, partial [Streptomyces sp. NPDC057307]|uniref:glycerate kinase n=1 Tax=Streptomyces sp. NPDC057307 TaxID=3346096 RepID=UPI0036339D75